MADVLDQQQAPQAPANGEPDFSSAFAERVEGGKKPEEDGAKPSEQEPAPAGSDAAPPAAAAEPDSGKAPAFDPYEGLTPEQKSYFARVQQSELSQRGRVGALTKKLNGLTAAAPPAPKQQEEQADEGEGGETASDLDKRLQAVTDEYGDVVGPIVEALKEVRGQIDQIGKTATTQAEVDADAAEMAAGLAELEKVHPDISSHGPGSDFDKWLAEQPEKVIGLANSFDPREVSLVLTLFKTERSAAIASQTGEGGDQGQQGSTATVDKRARQLEGSRALPNRGAPVAAQVPNDFSAAWKARAQQAR